MEFAGTPRRFLEMARAGEFRLSISGWIVEEVSRTLLTKFRWDEQRLNDAFADIVEFTVRVNAPRTLSVIAEDPDDDRVLECAVAASARFIVTGDNDLLRLGTFCLGVRGSCDLFSNALPSTDSPPYVIRDLILEGIGWLS